MRSELGHRSNTIQALAMLAEHGQQTSREVAERLPWLKKGTASAALSNAGMMGFASRSGHVWAISTAGREHLIRCGVDVALRQAEPPQPVVMVPIDASECRGWATACAAEYGRSG